MYSFTWDKKEKEKFANLLQTLITYASGDCEWCEEIFDPNYFFWMQIYESTLPYLSSKVLSNLTSFHVENGALLKIFVVLGP